MIYGERKISYWLGFNINQNLKASMNTVKIIKSALFSISLEKGWYAPGADLGFSRGGGGRI